MLVFQKSLVLLSGSIMMLELWAAQVWCSVSVSGYFLGNVCLSSLTAPSPFFYPLDEETNPEFSDESSPTFSRPESTVGLGRERVDEIVPDISGELSRALISTYDF